MTTTMQAHQAMFTATAHSFYSTLATDPDLSEIVEMFVEEMPRRIRDLQQQFVTNDWDELARLAHQLKGAAGSYGFDQITPYAARLERSVRNGLPMNEIRSAHEDLCEACARVRAGCAA